jgi:hypothetical protein
MKFQNLRLKLAALLAPLERPEVVEIPVKLLSDETEVLYSPFDPLLQGGTTGTDFDRI